MAVKRMEELGIDPMKMLYEVYTEAMAAYRSTRGLSDKSDSGPAYLSAAGHAAAKLAGYRYPTLTALAIKDMTEIENAKVINTQEAIEIMKRDPFAPKEIKEMKMTYPDAEIAGLPVGQGGAVGLKKQDTPKDSKD